MDCTEAAMASLRIQSLHSVGRLYLPSTASSPERMAQEVDWLQAGRHDLTFDISSLGRRVKLTYLVWFLPDTKSFFPRLLYTSSVWRTLSGTTTPFTELTHCGQVTQICVFTLQLCRTGDADLRF